MTREEEIAELPQEVQNARDSILHECGPIEVNTALYAIDTIIETYAGRVAELEAKRSLDLGMFNEQRRELKETRAERDALRVEVAELKEKNELHAKCVEETTKQMNALLVEYHALKERMIPRVVESHGFVLEED